MNTVKVNQKELFLMFYERLGNIKEAGLKAGFAEKIAFEEGAKILSNLSSAKKIEKLSKRFGKANIKQGLERLAFGNINDVVELIFSEEPLSISEIAHLDLFNVSEIKKVKGGGVEVKLFDRQKALEKLWEIENTVNASSTAESFFDALTHNSKEDNSADV